MSKTVNNTILLITFSLMLIGLAAVYSATLELYLEGAKMIFYRQVIWFVIGMATLLIVSNINYRRLFDIAYLLYGISIIFLIIVLIIGREIYGAQRWLELGGLNFQPSELSKFAVILLLSRYLSNKRFYSSRFTKLWHELIIPLIFVSIPIGLIFLQPDLGTSALIFFIFMTIMFFSDLELKYFLSFVGLILGLIPFIWHFLKDYQRDRLLVFLNPNIDPLGAGYTIIQSKIAIGSGIIFGKGWLSGTQSQLNFLPERHTDFIFSVIGEEWGFLGAVILLILYYLLISQAIKIVEQTKDRFSSFLALGIVSAIVFQAMVNILMTLGIFPVVGLSLPFISYGGSSLIIFCFLVGILLSINKRRIIF